MSPALTVTAPDGASFTFDEVKTAKGTKSLGEVPLMVWADASKALAFYGAEGISNILDGTSLRVSFQSIARRYKAANKTDDEIAKAQADFRPGKRAVGASTPTSRARRAADAASSKVDGDVVTALLEKIAKGELTEADLKALTA